MIGASTGISSLLTPLIGGAGGSAGASGGLLGGGFGPAAIVELGGRLHSDVPGYNTLARLNSGTTATLQSKLSQASQPVPIFSQRQLDEINATISETARRLQDGDFSGAKLEARKLLRRDPTDATGYAVLGRIAQAEGDLDSAVQHYERAASLAPDNERISDDLFNARQLRRSDDDVLGTSAQLVRNRTTAMKGLRLLFELAKRSPQQGEIYLHIAEGFGKLDLPVQQLGAFGVVEKEGTQADLAELELRLKDFISSQPPVGLAHSVLGRTQQKLGRFAEAFESLETARDIAPDVKQYSTELGDIHAALGNLALAKGDLASAEFQFSEARALDTTNPDFKFGLAAVLVERARQRVGQGLDDAARTFLSRAEVLLGADKSLNQGLAETYARLGGHALADGLDDLARVDFEKAFQRSSSVSGVRSNLADLYRSTGQAVLDAEPYSELSTKDFEKLTDNFQKAYDLYPTRDSWKADLAEALNEFGLKLMNVNTNYTRALEMFGRARKLYPDDATFEANYQQALNLKLTSGS